MRRFGRGGDTRSGGQVERLLVIGLGLLVVLLVQFAPPLVAGRRAATIGGPGAGPTATPSRAAGLMATATALAATPVVEADATPTPQATRAGVDPPFYRVDAGGPGANMRNAPSRTASIVREVRDGEVVTNLNQQQNAEGLTWRRVALGDVEGWVAAELLAPQRD